LAEVKVKIQKNKLDEAEILLSVLEKYYTSDIFIFYHSVKIPFVKKDWPKVQHFREKYILVSDNQIRRKSDINNKIVMMLNIELETKNEVYRSWNRKLFVVERAAKLLIHLHTAESFIGESRFDEAIKQANSVWELIKVNGKEDETRLKCRNIMPKLIRKSKCGKKHHTLLLKI
jgi:hypothetical protein